MSLRGQRRQFDTPGGGQWRQIIALITWVSVCGGQIVVATSFEPHQRMDDVSGQRRSSLVGCVYRADTGGPIRRATVTISQEGTRNSSFAFTDEAGCFNFGNLSAGRYILQASKTGFLTAFFGQSKREDPGRAVEISGRAGQLRADLRLQVASAVVGRVLDDLGEPVADVIVSLMRFQMFLGERRLVPSGRLATTNDIGEFRVFGLAPGRYILLAKMLQSNTSSSTSAMRTLGYAPTYFPGTPVLAQAKPISVGTGEVVDGLVLPIVRAATANLSGTVLDSDGRTVERALITATLVGSPATGPASSATSRSDGSFTLFGLAPGEYSVRSFSKATEQLPESAIADVVLDSSDISNIRLQQRSMSRVTGKLRFERGSVPLPAPHDFRVGASAIGTAELRTNVGGYPISAESTFEFFVDPGVYRLALVERDRNWFLKAARYRSADVTDSGLDATTNVEDVELVVTSQPSELTGYVSTEREAAHTRTTTVLAFAADRDLIAVPPRYIATAAIADGGGFSIRGLPPGDYWVAAVRALDPAAIGDLATFEALQRLAVRVHLRDGEPTIVMLKLADVVLR